MLSFVCFPVFAFGADLALPPSILADHIQHQQNEANASLQFGLFTFIAKLALALASAITFPLLDWADFTAGQQNTEASLHALSLAYAAIPCAIKLLSVALLWRAPLIENGETYVQEIHPSTVRSRHHA